MRSALPTVAWRAMLTVLAGLMLTGCYETRQEIFLNPDGTGRAVLESSFAEVDWLRNEKVTDESAVMRNFIQEAEGVDAWQDISCQEREDGRFLLRATAYFTELQKFKTRVNGFSRLSFSREGSGRIRLEARGDRAKSPVTLPTTNETVTAESIRRERRQFRANQPLLAAMLGSIKVETILHLPGSVERSSNFERTPTNSFRLHLDGARVLSAIERFVFDPEIARRRIEGTFGDMVDSHAGNELLYGQKGPVQVVMKGASRPLFDYAAEVAAARQAFPAWARTHGLPESLGTTGGASGPAMDGAPARIAVTGVELRYDAGTDGNVFHLSILREVGYSLKLRADLPGTVLDVNAVHLTRAVTVEGVSLHPPEVTNFKLGSFDATSGGTNVYFALGFGLPAAHCRGWAELTGEIECASAENLEAIELISGRLVAGARGTAFASEIESIGTSMSDTHRILLSTELEPKRMVWLKVYSDSNQVLELSRRGDMAVGNRRSYTFTASKAIPRTGRLVAGVLTGDQRLRIPFALTNITLLGQPLAAK